jgi:thiol:disulfide interchange protein DsbC
MIFKNLLLIVLSATSLMLSTAHAQAETAQEAAVKKAIEPRLGKGVKVDGVTKTPYAGLYEVHVGTNIFYTDEKARYIFRGDVVDAINRTNYTQNRIDEISKINFSDLPLANAAKSVRGNGKRVVAIFEDPNCGYCKRLRKTLLGMDNITVYTFMYNILSEDSAVKSKNIWCAPDRNKAWDDWMTKGTAPPAAGQSCISPNDIVFNLGRKLGVSATPTIFFTDGSRVSGAMEAGDLEEKFATIK